MTAKTYGEKIIDIVTPLFIKEGFKVTKLKNHSPFEARLKISNEGYYLHIETTLDKNLNSVNIKIHDPSGELHHWCNDTYTLNEPFANNKMLAEVANRIYSTFDEVVQ